jgi:hypothetical protein
MIAGKDIGEPYFLQRVMMTARRHANDDEIVKKICYWRTFQDKPSMFSMRPEVVNAERVPQHIPWIPPKWSTYGIAKS